jgi:hypothetical protein
MHEPHPILASQKAQVDAMIENAGFPLSEFKWSLVQSKKMHYWEVVSLEHTPTGGAFTFDFSKSEYSTITQRWSHRLPGRENLEDEDLMESWDHQRKYFGEWLDILKREVDPTGATLNAQPPPTQTSEAKSKVQSNTTVRVFISHSSADATIAEALADLIRQALQIDPIAIRCTSITDYALRYGDNAPEVLRQEIRSADVLIGIISPLSVESTWVLFELGARWGQNAYLVPALVGGTTTALIPPPISNLHAVRCESDRELIKLIEELAGRLLITNPLTSKYKRSVDELVKRATTYNTSRGPVASGQHHVTSPSASDPNRPIIRLDFGNPNLSEIGAKERDFMLLRNVGGRVATNVRIDTATKGDYRIEFDPVNFIERDGTVPVRHTTHRGGSFVGSSKHFSPAHGLKELLDNNLSDILNASLSLRITYTDTDGTKMCTQQTIHYDPMSDRVSHVSTEDCLAATPSNES